VARKRSEPTNGVAWYVSESRVAFTSMRGTLAFFARLSCGCNGYFVANAHNFSSHQRARITHQPRNEQNHPRRKRANLQKNQVVVSFRFISLTVHNNQPNYAVTLDRTTFICDPSCQSRQQQQNRNTHPRHHIDKITNDHGLRTIYSSPRKRRATAIAKSSQQQTQTQQQCMCCSPGMPQTTNPQHDLLGVQFQQLVAKVALQLRGSSKRDRGE